MPEHRRERHDVHARVAGRGAESAALGREADSPGRHRHLIPVPTRNVAAIVGALLLSSCALAHGAAPREPSAAVAYPAVRAEAAADVQAGRYGVADRLLADFTSQYPRTAEAANASYWRALYRMDPANQVASAGEATELVDSALAMPLDSAQRAGFLALRRISAALQRLATLVANAAPATGSDSLSRSEERPSSEEVQRLRSELAKANAELERIKKRVAQPKP